jgi:hypothetical protein
MSVRLGISDFTILIYDLRNANKSGRQDQLDCRRAALTEQPFLAGDPSRFFVCFVSFCLSRQSLVNSTEGNQGNEEDFKFVASARERASKYLLH